MREQEGATALTAAVPPSLDLVFDLLSNSRRRYVLYDLNDRPDGVATIENLTENVIALEEATACDTADGESTTGSTADSDATDQRTGVQLELQHVHLPKLEDAGVLEHDRRSETVRYWTQPSLEEWLEHAHHKEFE
ncbi:hypothetical protein [Natrinema pallidum]|uniref:DUF7344 domain-containing protein n=2 Tax=Natrinema pallidum TaxID=69527 RepID=L9YZW0_9EURY|nr:hypothetical protein [Natrinema pallidum]ELY79800.1 hypothetical protein C487_05424 [Natrinema pallidum DSM 3751]QCW02324.1 hypothetical protein FGF80_03350 [Natrinema pallidum]